jgi:hypothetical protein
MMSIKVFMQTGAQCSKVLKSKEFSSYANLLKKAAIVSQTTAGSVILQRGRMSPMRLMWWPENQVLLGGIIQVFPAVCRNLIWSNPRVCRNLIWHNPSIKFFRSSRSTTGLSRSSSPTYKSTRCQRRRTSTKSSLEATLTSRVKFITSSRLHRLAKMLVDDYSRRVDV